MKILAKRKDGGPESNVTGYFLIEIKLLFSIVLLRFDAGSREAYHSHAFSAVSWILNGVLCEYLLETLRSGDKGHGHMWAGMKPIFTSKDRFHKVANEWGSPVWALSFRGPWRKWWKEYREATYDSVLMTTGRNDFHTTPSK